MEELSTKQDAQNCNDTNDILIYSVSMGTVVRFVKTKTNKRKTTSSFARPTTKLNAGTDTDTCSIKQIKTHCVTLTGFHLNPTSYSLQFYLQERTETSQAYILL